MNIIDKFSIQDHEGDYEKRPLKSLLYYRGKALEKKVSGYVIEKQFELDDYFLLLTNWDCQFEESCEIIVINKRQEIVGNYSFTSFYNSYNLRAVCELSKNNFRLTFNESDNFEVIINYPKKHLLSKVVTVSAIHGSNAD